MIQVHQLTIGFDDHILLKELEFGIERGDVFVILGGSGCGKSTLLRHLIGLEAPQTGSIEIDGIGHPHIDEKRPPFGVLFQSGALLGSLTVAENVALPLRRWTHLEEEAIQTVVRSKLRLVGLSGYENHLPAQISGGMKKRAGIARALALDSSLLFLDEPSAGLDPVTSSELDDLIVHLNQILGTTIVIVTHELASIFRIGRNSILLDKSEQGIIARGDPRRLRDESHDPRVRRFFLRGATPDKATLRSPST